MKKNHYPLIDESLTEGYLVPPENLDNKWGRLTTALLGVVALTEILPSNEVIRLGLYGMAEGLSHKNPIYASFAAGLSTFVVEEAGGAAMASLSGTGKAKDINDKVDEKISKIKFLNRFKIFSERKISRESQFFATVLGGTVVGMTLKQYQNPERSSRDNHRYSLITSAWLGGLMMGMGFLASEGINMEIDNPIRTGVFASGAVLSGFIIRKLKKVFFKEKNDQQE